MSEPLRLEAGTAKLGTGQLTAAIAGRTRGGRQGGSHTHTHTASKGRAREGTCCSEGMKRLGTGELACSS
eukprot:264824-Rhodomonas_salina.2